MPFVKDKHKHVHRPSLKTSIHILGSGRLESILGAIHTSELDRSEIDLKSKAI